MSHSERFHRQLERVRVRAMLAAERACDSPDDEVLLRLDGRLVALERELAEPTEDDRGLLLAWRLGLEDFELDLVWTVVAASIDPLLVSHLGALGGRDALRGATLSVHAKIWELSGEEARTLAIRLVGGHPLFLDHMLAWTGENTIPTRTLVAAPRTISWLAGDDTLDVALLGAGSVLAAPEQEAPDTRLYESLLTTPAPLVIVDGTMDPVILPAAARKIGREVIALDLRFLSLDALDAALIGLRRECRLRDALPLVLHLEELESDPRALRVVTSAIARMPGPFAATSRHRELALAVPRPVIHLSANPNARS
ncbi:MAG TPA: hypothetical protein VIU61_07150 [Kofleriaceae bacterium]